MNNIKSIVLKSCTQQELLTLKKLFNTDLFNKYWDRLVKKYYKSTPPKDVA